MMADFLAKLAARTLGVEPVAQPLIASMYAPGLELLSSLNDSPTGQEMEGAADDSSLAPPIPSTPLAVPPPVHFDADVPLPESQPHARHHVETEAYGFVDQRDNEEGGTPQENLSIQPSRHRGVRRRVEPDGSPEQPSPPQDPSTPRPSERARATLPPYRAGPWPGRYEVSTLLVPVEPPVMRSPAHREGIPLTHDPTDLLPASMAMREEEAVEPGIMPRQPAGDKPSARQTPDPAEFSGLEPVPLTPAQPGPPSAEARAYRHAGDEPGEPPGPIIHVSIGRVEVRAVMQAPLPPSPPTSPLPPRLSLDEYLRSQNGGQR